MELIIVEGAVLDQKVDAIINPWNRNLIPWWLLLPKGVSGAIKKRAGIKPFIELRRSGVLPYTGQWCKKHYYRTMILHPLGTIGCLIWGVALIAILLYIIIAPVIKYVKVLK